METRILTLQEFKQQKDVVRYIEIVVQIYNFMAPVSFYYVGDLFELLTATKYYDLSLYKVIEAITLMSQSEFEIISLNQRELW